MKFALGDGTVVSGRSYRDVVRRMADLKLQRSRVNISRYMKATAERIHTIYPDKHIDTSNPQAFIKSLLEQGLLARIQ